MASEELQKKVDKFFHHGKTEHPPTDTEVGKTPAGEPRGSEAQPEEFHTPLKEPVERRVENALKQADEYGHELDPNQTKPQTLLPEQNPFGATHDSDTVTEPREEISIHTANLLDK